MGVPTVLDVTSTQIAAARANNAFAGWSAALAQLTQAQSDEKAATMPILM